MCDWRQGGGCWWTLETRKELSPPWGSTWDPFTQTPVHFKCQVKKSRTPQSRLTWELKREIWAPGPWIYFPVLSRPGVSLWPPLPAASLGGEEEGLGRAARSPWSLGSKDAVQKQVFYKKDYKIL